MRQQITIKANTIEAMYSKEVDTPNWVFTLGGLTDAGWKTVVTERGLTYEAMAQQVRNLKACGWPITYALA